MEVRPSAEIPQHSTIGPNASFRHSSYLRTVALEGGFLVAYHTLFGNPLIVAPRGVDLFSSFRNPTSPAAAARNCGMPLSEVIEVVECFADSILLVSPDLDERNALDITREAFLRDVRAGRRCNALSLVVTEGCNFKCPHCLPKKVADSYRANDGHPSRMALDTAVKAVDDFLDFTRESKYSPQLYFGGREPLLNWPVIRDAILHAEKRSAESGRELSTIIFTNCSMVTSEIAEFLGRRRDAVYIATSLDGVGEHNDKQRIASHGKSAFEETLRGWSLLRDAGVLEKTFNCTFSKHGVDALSWELIEFAKEWGMTTISLNPDETSLRETDADSVTRAILDFEAEAAANGVNVVGQWKMVFDNLFRNVGNSVNTGFCSAYNGHSVAVRAGGRYSLCSPDPRLLAPEMPLREFLSTSAYTTHLESHYAGNIKFCKGCSIEGFCMGGCGVASDTALANGFDPYVRCGIFRSTFDTLLLRCAEDQCADVDPGSTLPVPLAPP